MAIRTRKLIGILVLLGVLGLFQGTGRGQGTSQDLGIFLSAILGDHAEVTRGWPQKPTDIQVFPYTPQFWKGCAPGQGAIATLITAPLDLPPFWAGLSSYYAPKARVEAVISAHLGSQGRSMGGKEVVLANWLVRLATPGDPVREAGKAVFPEVRNMATYEKYGYAVFLLLKWEWRSPRPGCYPTLVSVPEGYRIPFVR
ncbi:MAG: hypothetical protein QN198_05160 [Armatimonadota bacterium]|nr:hypothetical protein [Armatimonadota bacterium]MDR5702974.1 hypothetical protein [Armatimonadota bacterium]